MSVAGRLFAAASPSGGSAAAAEPPNELALVSLLLVARHLLCERVRTLHRFFALKTLGLTLLRERQSIRFTLLSSSPQCVGALRQRCHRRLQLRGEGFGGFQPISGRQAMPPNCGSIR